jgi:hypothetical protein
MVTISDAFRQAALADATLLLTHASLNSGPRDSTSEGASNDVEMDEQNLVAVQPQEVHVTAGNPPPDPSKMSSTTTSQPDRARPPSRPISATERIGDAVTQRSGDASVPHAHAGCKSTEAANAQQAHRHASSVERFEPTASIHRAVVSEVYCGGIGKTDTGVSAAPTQEQPVAGIKEAAQAPASTSAALVPKGRTSLHPFSNATTALNSVHPQRSPQPSSVTTDATQTGQCPPEKPPHSTGLLSHQSRTTAAPGQMQASCLPPGCSVLGKSTLALERATIQSNSAEAVAPAKRKTVHERDPEAPKHMRSAVASKSGLSSVTSSRAAATPAASVLAATPQQNCAAPFVASHAPAARSTVSSRVLQDLTNKTAAPHHTMTPRKAASKSLLCSSHETVPLKAAAQHNIAQSRATSVLPKSHEQVTAAVPGTPVPVLQLSFTLSCGNLMYYTVQPWRNLLSWYHSHVRVE